VLKEQRLLVLELEEMLVVWMLYELGAEEEEDRFVEMMLEG
jgi:hypothetical protein